jgi:hypothetical protein
MIYVIRRCRLPEPTIKYTSDMSNHKLTPLKRHSHIQIAAADEFVYLAAVSGSRRPLADPPRELSTNS